MSAIVLTLDTLRGRVIRLARARTRLAIAAEMGIAPRTLARLLRDEGNITVDCLCKIEVWCDAHEEKTP